MIRVLFQLYMNLTTGVGRLSITVQVLLHVQLAPACIVLSDAPSITPAPPGSMDEVLASLQRGEIQLRRVDAKAAPATDVRDSILSAIRLGVKLRKVQPPSGPQACPGSQASELELSIKAAMQRMKKVSADSDDETGVDSCQSGDWDN